MNFDQWKQLSKQRQKEIAKDWDIKKDEGWDIAASVLTSFIEQHGSNKNIEIDRQIIRLRDNAGWTIGVQCFNRNSLKATPAKYMGIAVSRLHIDHIEDGIFFDWIPPKLCQRRALKTSIFQ